MTHLIMAFVKVRKYETMSPSAPDNVLCTIPPGIDAPADVLLLDSSDPCDMLYSMCNSIVKEVNFHITSTDAAMHLRTLVLLEMMRKSKAIGETRAGAYNVWNIWYNSFIDASTLRSFRDTCQALLDVESLPGIKSDSILHSRCKEVLQKWLSVEYAQKKNLSQFKKQRSEFINADNTEGCSTYSAIPEDLQSTLKAYQHSGIVDAGRLVGVEHEYNYPNPTFFYSEQSSSYSINPLSFPLNSCLGAETVFETAEYNDTEHGLPPASSASTVDEIITYRGFAQICRFIEAMPDFDSRTTLHLHYDPAMEYLKAMKFTDSRKKIDRTVFDVISTGGLVESYGLLGVLSRCSGFLKLSPYSTLLTNTVDPTCIVNECGVSIPVLTLMLGLYPQNLFHANTEICPVIHRQGMGNPRVRWKTTPPAGIFKVADPEPIIASLVSVYDTMFQHLKDGVDESSPWDWLYTPHSFAEFVSNVNQRVPFSWYHYVLLEEAINKKMEDNPLQLAFKNEFLAAFYRYKCYLPPDIEVEKSEFNENAQTVFQKVNPLPVCQLQLLVPRVLDLHTLMNDAHSLPWNPRFELCISAPGTEPMFFSGVDIKFTKRKYSPRPRTSVSSVFKLYDAELGVENGHRRPDSMVVTAYVPTKLVAETCFDPKTRISVRFVETDDAIVHGKDLKLTLSDRSATDARWVRISGGSRTELNPTIPPYVLKPTSLEHAIRKPVLALEGDNIEFSFKISPTSKESRAIADTPDFVTETVANSVCDYRIDVSYSKDIPTLPVHFPVPISFLEFHFQEPTKKSKTCDVFATRTPKFPFEAVLSMSPKFFNSALSYMKLSQLSNLDTNDQTVDMVNHALRPDGAIHMKIGKQTEYETYMDIIENMFASYSGTKPLSDPSREKLTPSPWFQLVTEKLGVNMIFHVNGIISLPHLNSLALDVCVAPLRNDSAMEFGQIFQSIGHENVHSYNVSDETLFTWKTLLPTATERVRESYNHYPDCIYQNSATVPASFGSGHRFLCECAEGMQLPKAFESGPIGTSGLSQYFYRAALPFLHNLQPTHSLKQKEQSFQGYKDHPMPFGKRCLSTFPRKTSILYSFPRLARVMFK